MQHPLGMFVPQEGRDAQRFSPFLRATNSDTWRVPMYHDPSRLCVFSNGIHFEELDHGDQSFCGQWRKHAGPARCA